MKFIISTLLLLYSFSLFSQNCYDTIQTDWIQFCEFKKDHQQLTDCDGHDCKVIFIIKENEIIKINGKDIEVYDIDVFSENGSVFDDDCRISTIYFLEKMV